MSNVLFIVIFLFLKMVCRGSYKYDGRVTLPKKQNNTRSYFSSEFYFKPHWVGCSPRHIKDILQYTWDIWLSAFNILLCTASIWCSCIWYHGSLEYCLWKPLRRQRENIYTRKEKTQTKSAFVFSQHPEWKDLGGFTLFEKRSLRALLLGAR